MNLTDIINPHKRKKLTILFQNHKCQNFTVNNIEPFKGLINEINEFTQTELLKLSLKRNIRLVIKVKDKFDTTGILYDC